MVPAPICPEHAYMHEIQTGLWLGSARAACDKAALLDLGITHILSLGVPNVAGSRQRFRLPPSGADPFTRLIVVVDDSTSARLNRHFEACSNFIQECLSSNATILVHCQAGQSRSPTIVAAHFMFQYKWTAHEALDYVRQRRACVHPNPAFLSQLYSLQAQLGLSVEPNTDAEALYQEVSDDPRLDTLVEAPVNPSHHVNKVARSDNDEALAKLAKLRARLGANRMNGQSKFNPPARRTSREL